MILALLFACATVPVAPAESSPTGGLTPVAPVVVAQPSPRPPPGSLWSEVEARALIGMDGNARRVGDLITVLIIENAATNIDADTKSERKSDNSFGIDAALGLDTSILRANPDMGSSIGLGGSSESKFDGKAQTSRSGSLRATVTCQVEEVLPNGNLRIRGTKQVRVSRETQFLVLSGIVRPRDILLDNTVQSNLIAEARIEFTGAGVVADKQGPGWGTRVADTLWPF
jgi:flagellar L-ring protein precursor FlgH